MIKYVDSLGDSLTKQHGNTKGHSLYNFKGRDRICRITVTVTDTLQTRLTQHKTIYHIKRRTSSWTSTSASTSSVQPSSAISRWTAVVLPSFFELLSRSVARRAVHRGDIPNIRWSVRCNSRRGQFWSQSVSSGNVSEPIYCCSPHRIVSLRTIPRSERINRDPIRQNHKEKKT